MDRSLMDEDNNRLSSPFGIGPHRVDPGANRITNGEYTSVVEPKAMAVLCVLAYRAGETVSREQLLQLVWPGRVVVEETLTRAISQLRNALGDSPKESSYIRTVPKQGYRLVAEVNTLAPASKSVATEPTPKPVDPPSPPTAEATRRRWWPGIAIAAALAAALWLLWPSTLTPMAPKTPTAKQPVAVASARPSLAVLPFRNLSADPQSGYFAEGVSEELLAALASVPGLRVPSRRSSFAFKGQDVSLAEIADALQVRHILEGSVRRSGNTLRISAQLIDASSDSNLWSRQYERDLDGVFAVQQEIANEVASVLQGKLLANSQSVEISRTENIQAYNAYLQGLYWWMNGDISAWYYQARDSFEHAVTLDPDFAPAHAGLAYIYARSNYYNNYQPIAVTEEKARQAIEKALSLDDSSVNAYIARAVLAMRAADFDTAQRDLQRAVELNPNDSTARFLESEMWLKNNQPLRALAAAEKALSLDPLSPWINVNMALMLFHLDRKDDADTMIDQALAIDPDNTWALAWRAIIAHSRGAIAQAIKAMQTCVEVDASSPVNAAYLGFLFLELEEHQQAQVWFERAAALHGNSDEARFWAGLTERAIANQHPETVVALAPRLGRVEATPYSLVPTLHTAFANAEKYQQGIELLRKRYPGLTSAKNPTVRIHNVDAAMALSHLLQAADKSAINLTAAIEETINTYPALLRWQAVEAQLLALKGRQQEALQSLKQGFDQGWVRDWWSLQHHPALQQLTGLPEYAELTANIRQRIAEQRQLLPEVLDE
ncbi:winged helix-turn-helix domain-containing protein [Porticoccus sp. W117]|uniref:winged helix-turn-helix domain-containing protein n=1 Tax=Porticoccus sp. W117 TaxID=3054777 RepID=UPI0025948586|nr:winged helix-turn-helix domain-containing protein [Porticoccus sp. W117]MDM3871403.1 winged helix-turn-helix domain-containing protein [Porticoccus sp. W117]